MPVIKHYECADTFNTLKVEIYDDCLLLTTKENDNEIKIFLTIKYPFLLYFLSHSELALFIFNQYF